MVKSRQTRKVSGAVRHGATEGATGKVMAQAEVQHLVRMGEQLLVQATLLFLLDLKEGFPQPAPGSLADTPQ